MKSIGRFTTVFTGGIFSVSKRNQCKKERVFIEDKDFEPACMISYYETGKKEMRASCLAEIARALYTTPDYLLGFEEKQDSFEAEALGILQGIKDDTVRERLLKQMKALV